MESTAYINERWHFLMTDAVQSIDSQGIGCTAFIDEIWSTHYLLMKERVHSIYSWETEHTTFNHEGRSKQYLAIRVGIHNIFIWEMECTLYYHYTWSPRDWFEEMATRPLTHERRSPYHLLRRDGTHSIYWKHMKSAASITITITWSTPPI